VAKSSENNYYISHYISETTKLSEISNDDANMLVGMSNVEECGWLINTVASLEEEEGGGCEVESSGSDGGNGDGEGYTGSEEGKDRGKYCAGGSSKGERRRGRGRGRQESALQQSYNRYRALLASEPGTTESANGSGEKLEQSLMNGGVNGGGDTVASTSATASTNGGTTSREDDSADGNSSTGSGSSSSWQSLRRKRTSRTDHSGSSSNDRDSTCSNNSRSGSVGEATSVEGSETGSVSAQYHRLSPSNKNQ
jgi:hypothetical protein